MAKTRVIKKRKHILRQFVFSLFFFVLLLYGTTALFVRSYQATLVIQIQQTENRIAHIKTQNEALSMDIARLSNYDRIVAMASEEGFTSVHQNVITVSNNE